MEIKKNDIYEVVIEDLGSEGQGIGKVDGYTLFVKDALIGDVILAKVIKTKKTYGYGRLMQILKPSPHRVEAKCPVAKACGGCQIQHLAYKEQLAFKENKVKNLLKRVGKLDHFQMEPIIGMEQPYYYRNKAQFPVGKNKDGKIVAGFYAGRTHAIIDTEKCYIQAPVNQQIVQTVRLWMEENHITPYDEISREGLIRHILTRVGFKTGEIMVCLVINGKKLPKWEGLVKELTKISGMTSISYNINQESTNVILGEKVVTIWGKDRITDYIGDVKYEISPLSFYQVNPVQTEKLYGKVLEFAAPKSEETVWDLYCGIGTISLFLAQKASRVYGVEIVPQAILDARRNAQINGFHNVEFFVGKAEEVLVQTYEKDHTYADVIVVDPPRKGCDQNLLQCMLKMKPKRIVYVSCDPATLARDLCILAQGGYNVEKVQCVDMFPQSVHVESIVLLSKLHAKQNIKVELEMSEMDLTAAESKATYEEIKEYVLKHTGLKVSNLYIAQVKEKCGIKERENYNTQKSDSCLQLICPVEKEKAIKDAFKYFKMI